MVYGCFEKALKPFVEDGAAQAYRGSTTVSEDLLGEYEITTLIIEIVGRRILLVPIARVTVAGTGRLDLYREDRPSELNRILLVRGEAAAAHNPDLWMIQDRRKNVSQFEQKIGFAISMLQPIQNEFRGLSDEAIQDSVDYILNV